MFKRILIAVDGKPGGRDAMALARALASSDTSITLTNVYGAGLMPGRGAALLLADERSRCLKFLEAEREILGLPADLHPYASHSIGDALHELAGVIDADLLIVGASRRRRLGRAMLGNDTISALNGAPCAVAIAPRQYATAASGIHAIGVGCDSSPESERALAIARDLAHDLDATTVALAVVSCDAISTQDPDPDNWPEVTRRLTDARRARLQRLGVEARVLTGEPSEELEALGREVDLLVVGSRGYGLGGRLLYGSTSNYLAHRVRCPLLVVPRAALRRPARDRMTTPHEMRSH
jgi:nucleotide-binding universal stress UspA family protein